MYVALDVHYAGRVTVTAAVGFESWTDGTAAIERVFRSDIVPAAYEPGAFYRRELPYLKEAVTRLERHHAIDALIIDGHVWLRNGVPGLGAHLYIALGGRTPVIGVAKSRFAGSDAVAILRGRSKQPLFVTAAGMDGRRASELVRVMHGPHRLPTLLKHADQLARAFRSTPG